MKVLNSVDKFEVFGDEIFTYTVNIKNISKGYNMIKTYFPSNVVYVLPTIENYIESICIKKTKLGDYVSINLNTKKCGDLSFDILCSFDDISNDDCEFINEVEIFKNNKIFSKTMAEKVVLKRLNINYLNESDCNSIVYIPDKKIRIDSEFNPYEDIYAVDYLDNDISSNVVVTYNNIDIKNIGIYQVSYSIVDYFENYSDFNIAVNVVDDN